MNNTPQFTVRELRGKKKMRKKLLQSYKGDEVVYEQTCTSLKSPRKEQAFINVTRKEIDAHQRMAAQNKVGHNRNVDSIDRARLRTPDPRRLRPITTIRPFQLRPPSHRSRWELTMP